MMAFLPEVSPLICRPGRQELNIAAVSEEPVRITRSMPSWETRLLPTDRSAGYTPRSSSRGTPASHSASRISMEQCGVGFDGLWITPAPAASAAKVPPAGMASGKFHGGVTSTTRSGVKVALRTSDRASAQCA